MTAADHARPALRLSEVAPMTAEGGNLLVDVLAALATYGVHARPLAGPADPAVLEPAGCVVVGHGDRVLVAWPIPAHHRIASGPVAGLLLRGVAAVLAGLTLADDGGPMFGVEVQAEDDTAVGLLVEYGPAR